MLALKQKRVNLRHPGLSNRHNAQNNVVMQRYILLVVCNDHNFLVDTVHSIKNTKSSNLTVQSILDTNFLY